MTIKTATCLAFAAACLAAATIPGASAQTGSPTVVVEPPPRVDPGDLNWNPLSNLKEAQQYDRLLETNPAFRMARIQKECGPITDPQLHADCVASFNQFEPMVASTTSPQRIASSGSSRHHQTHYVGSSTAPRHYQSHYGR
jgi:hypothetical protein